MSSFRNMRRRMGNIVMQKISGTDVDQDPNIRNLEPYVERFRTVKDAEALIKRQLTALFAAQNGVFDAEKALTHMQQEEGVASAVVTALTTPATATAYRRGFKITVMDPLVKMESLFAQVETLLKDRATYLVDYQHHKRKLEILEERLTQAQQNSKKVDKVGELKQDVANRERRKAAAAQTLRQATEHLIRKVELSATLLPQVEEHVAKGVAATYIAMAEASLFAFEWSLERYYHADDGPVDATPPSADADPDAPAPRPGGEEIREIIRGMQGSRGAEATPDFIGALEEELAVSVAPSLPAATPSGSMGRFAPANAGAVFGRPLEGVPQLVLACIAFLDARGLYEKGLFRVPGNAALINDMRAALDAGDFVDFAEEPPAAVNDVAALFKMYFRLLPEPLIPSRHFHAFLAATRAPNFAGTVRGMIERDFPEANRQTLRLLLAFLSRVERLEEVNMMSADNLGIVFAPNLLRPGPDEDERVENIQPANHCCKLLISEVASIFPNLWHGYPQNGDSAVAGGVPASTSPASATSREQFPTAAFGSNQSYGRDPNAGGAFNSATFSSNGRQSSADEGGKPPMLSAAGGLTSGAMRKPPPPPRFPGNR